MTDLIYACEAPDCEIKHYKVDNRFRMKKSNEYASFCVQCAPYMSVEFGWELKSRDGLEKFKLMTGDDFYPELDPEEYESPTVPQAGTPNFDDAENRQKMREERELKHKEDVLKGSLPVDESSLS